MLKHRSLQKEQMDNLNFEGEELIQTLDGLSVINKFFGNTSSIFEAVKNDISVLKFPLTIVDLGCGGGDNLRAISQWCTSKNITIKLIGIDGNASILEYARNKNSQALEVEYLQADILNEKFELPLCDIMISSHFMYHFSDEKLVLFLKSARKKVRRKIILSELERSTFAYVLFKIGGAFLPFSKMVKQDGLLAIRRAFSREELVSIFVKASIKRYNIQWRWAFRFLISIDAKIE